MNDPILQKLTALSDWQIRHQVEDTAAFKSIEQNFYELKNNHLEHLSQDVSTIKDKLTEVRQDVQWLKKSYWVLFTASIGGLITAMLAILFRH